MVRLANKSTVAVLGVLVLTAGCIPKGDTQAAPTSSQGSASQGSKPEEEAPTLDIVGGCKADDLQRHLGKALTPAFAEQLKKEAGAQILRTAHENGMITMDFNSGRLNLFYNDVNTIVRIDCG